MLPQAAGFTNSASRSGEKLVVFLRLAIFSAQRGMYWGNLGLPTGSTSSTGSDQDSTALISILGAAAQSNADEGPDAALPWADLLMRRCTLAEGLPTDCKGLIRSATTTSRGENAAQHLERKPSMHSAKALFYLNLTLHR